MRTLYYLIFPLLLLTPSLSAGQSVRLDRIIAISDQFVFTGKSGAEYKLAAIRLPDKENEGHPKSLNLLGKMILGKEVRLEIPDKSIDRYGRLHVDMYDADNNWLNALFIENGLAILSGAQAPRDKLNRLRQLELAAEQSGAGLWQTGHYKTYVTTPYEGQLYRFAIVEGVVLQAKKVKSRIYLNFEADWRKDFSIAIDKPLWDSFAKQGIMLDELAGQHIRARGWLRKYNGPFLEINQPGQLQLR